MKLRLFTLIMLLVLVAYSSCKNQKPTSERVLPEIDITKEYPIKEVFLGELLDLEFISLETNDSSIITSLSSIEISDKFIVAEYSNAILIFDGSGKFINSFKYQGGARNEYKDITDLCVDFENNEIFIYDFDGNTNKIQVYTFEGEFNRTLELPEKYKFNKGHLLNYDNEYLITSDDKYLDFPNLEDKVSTDPYILISKKDGSIEQIPIKVENRYGYRTFNIIRTADKTLTQPIIIPTNKMVRLGGEIIISEFALDTIFMYRDKKLIPFLSLKNRGENQYLTEIVVNSKKYIILKIMDKKLVEENGNYSFRYNKTFMYDKELDEVYEIELMDDIDYINFGGSHSIPAEYHTSYPIDAYKLIELNEEGKISGELQKIASELNEEDNLVLILGKF